LWNSNVVVKDWVSTGIYPLDVVLSNTANGGFPNGRLSEISGAEGAGKTLMAACALAETQRAGGVAILIDTEHAASLDVFKAVGVDVKKLVYIQAGTVEEVFKTMETVVSKVALDKSNKKITIVWDSIAATSTKAEVEADYDQNTVAMTARLLSKGLRKYIPLCNAHNVCLIFVNQLRTKIGITFGDDKVSPGGAAVPFHASIRLRISVFKSIKDSQGRLLGRIIKCDVKKNKVAPPMRTMLFTIRWGERPGAWISQYETYWDTCDAAGIFKKITTQKRSFVFPSTGKESPEFTKKAFRELIKDEAFLTELKSAIAKEYIITEENISDEVSAEDVDKNEGD